MGFDLLDIVLRLEVAFFPLRLTRADVEQMVSGKTARTMTAGDVYDHMLMRLRSEWPRTLSECIDHDLYCSICRYNLRGLTPDRGCPECGTPMQFEDHVWHGVCEVLSAALGVEPDTIRRESRLMKDLGASF